MLMSVFRREHRPGRLDHLTLISGASGPEEVAMITFALTMNQPVLASHEGAPAIIKPFAAGDELLSYDALYDTCITAKQYQRMRQAKVKKVEDLPLHLYEVELKLDIELINPGATVQLLAASDVDGRERLRRLVFDQEFRLRLAVHVVLQLMRLISDEDGVDDKLDVLVGGLLKIDEVPPPDTPEWQIMKELKPDDA
jgi:hypothetical protein